LKPDVYEPELNPLHRGVLRHYGVVTMTACVRARRHDAVRTGNI
jgi:hypothetical protein